MLEPRPVVVPRGKDLFSVNRALSGGRVCFDRPPRGENVRRLFIVALAALLVAPAIPAGAQPTIDGVSPPTHRDDGPEVSISDASTVEGSGDLAFTVSLAEASDYPVGVMVRTEDGTAKANSDYRATVRRIVVPAGETSADLTVYVNDDARPERDEVMGVIKKCFDARHTTEVVGYMVFE